MCNTYIDLISSYKEFYEKLISYDTKAKGFYFNKDRKYWVVYGYEDCSNLLSNAYVSKKRMLIPLELFDKERGLVERFLHLINKSIIFRDDKKSGVVRLIHDNYKKIDILYIIERLLGKEKIIDEQNLSKLNNYLASLLVGFESDISLTKHAENVGMLFDGRVRDKEHFISIVKSFLIIFDVFKRFYNTTDINTSDIVVTYIAAHQTTMQLIVASLYNIYKFNLSVTRENVRDIITESSRLCSPILCMGRIVTKNINYKDFIFKKGDRIMFYTGMANFDPNVFKNPFEFSLNRYEKPLSFGSGVHMCIGMGISLSFSSKCVDFICSNYSIKNVSVFELIKGVSSLGAFRFSIEVG